MCQLSVISPPLNTPQGFIDPHKDADDTSSSGIGIESASEDFETGDLSSGSSQSEDTPPQEGWKPADFSEQVMRYKQQKPKKAKDVTSRESVCGVCVCVCGWCDCRCL